MERTMISWNIANWITVVLMAFGFWVALGLAAQLAKNYGPSSAQGGGF